MGIRIHKTMGYGLANLKCKGHKIVDKRINPKGILGLDWEEQEVVYSRLNYAKWLRERYEACGGNYSGDKLYLSGDMVDAEHHSNGNQKAGEPWECFIHQPEYGLPKVLNIIPYQARFNDWYRFDNDMDYYEEIARNGKGSGHINRYEILKDCFYPWLNYWDVRTGRKVGDSAFHFRRLVNAKAKHGSYDMIRAAEDCGFANPAEAVKFMQPMPPRHLELFCEFTQVFTDPTTIRELRPMIYVYWC